MPWKRAKVRANVNETELGNFAQTATPPDIGPAGPNASVAPKRRQHPAECGPSNVKRKAEDVEKVVKCFEANGYEKPSMVKGTDEADANAWDGWADLRPPPRAW